ncbi:MAG: MFS transporter [Deltaproteobacteria bacterium]|nr:MFS transporter [Deltaproteobacteria bacterium]
MGTERPQTNYSAYRWVVLFVFMYAIALTQFLWLNFAPIETAVRQQLGIDVFKVGLLTSIFPILSIILSAPVGTLLDAKGFRFTVSLGVIIMGVSVLLRLKYHSYAWLFAGQFGISVAQPFILNSVSKFASVWFDKDESVIANGLGSMAMFIGMIAAMVITPVLVAGKGLGYSLYVYAGITLLGSILFLLLGKDNPSLSSSLKEEEKEYKGMDAYKSIFGMKDMLLLIAIMFIGIGFFNGLMTWMDELLSQNGFSTVQTGTIGGVIIGGGILGALAIPLLSDVLKRRKPFLIIATLLGGSVIYPFLDARSMTSAMVLGAVIGFFVISLLPIILQMTTEIVGERLTGTATGLLMLIGSVGAVVVIYLMEWIKNVTNSFRNSIWLMMAFFVAALVLSILIKETHPDRGK